MTFISELLHWFTWTSGWSWFSTASYIDMLNTFLLHNLLVLFSILVSSSICTSKLYSVFPPASITFNVLLHYPDILSSKISPQNSAISNIFFIVPILLEIFSFALCAVHCIVKICYSKHFHCFMSFLQLSKTANLSLP